MNWSKLALFSLSLTLVTLFALTSMVFLPQDKFLRYQSLREPIAPTASWIYERIHFDPTPIDVAFIGTSRTGMSIHSARLQEDLDRGGVHANVVNLHVVRTGRNMHYTIAKELLEHRKVKLLVLEINEWEDRKPHPDFIFLADPDDVVEAPLFINFSYLSDLARLPGRQLGLFFDTFTNEHHIGESSHVLPPYPGPHLDHAEFIEGPNGERYSRDIFRTEAEMQKLEAVQAASITPRMLPTAFDWLEYRIPRYYVNQIRRLAADTHTRLVFLYIPRYGAPPVSAPYAALYADKVPLINPWPVLQDHRRWFDATHVNWEGAKALTDFVAGQILAEGYLSVSNEPELTTSKD